MTPTTSSHNQFANCYRFTLMTATIFNAPALRHYKLFMAGGLALVFAGLAVFSPSTTHYPLVRISGAELNTTMVMRPAATPASCQATLHNITTSIHGACPSCNTTASQCTSTLAAPEAQLLTDAPLATYSALLPQGVALYEAANPAIAQQACLQSEQQSSIKGFVVRCFAPHTPRSIPQTAVNNSLNLKDLWAALCAVSLLALGLQLLPIFSTRYGHQALGLDRGAKQALMVLSDVLALELSLYFALALRFESLQVPTTSLPPLMLAAPVLALPIFLRFGLYRAVMRYVGLQAIVAIAKAVALYTVLLTALVFVLALQDVPRSVPWIHGLLTLLFIGGSRTVARQWLSLAQHNHVGDFPRKRTLIFGAGSAGVQLALALSHSREMQPVAFVDDDPKLHRKQIAGLTVYGRQDLVELVQRVAAHGDFVFARSCPSNADGNGIGLAARTGKAGHVGPGVQLNQPLGKVDLFGAVEGGHITGVHCLAHSGVHLFVSIAQNIGANAHDGHVGILLAVHVPHLATFGFAEVCRPLIRKEHFGALREQHTAARYHALGSLPEFLTCSDLGAFVTHNMLIYFENFWLCILKCHNF